MKFSLVFLAWNVAVNLPRAKAAVFFQILEKDDGMELILFN